MGYDYSAAGAAWQAPYFQKLDPTHAAIRKAINQFRYSSFTRFAFDMCVSPCDTRSETAGLGHHPSPQKFLFEADGKTPHKMMVKIDANQGVVVKLYPRQYVPIADYLKLLPIIQDPNTYSMDFRLEHQSCWWLSNKKKFALLDLPSEVREMIYSYAVGPYLDPYPTARFRTRRVHYVPNVALMHANKQVYFELKHILYDKTPFHIEYSRLFERMIRNSEFPLSQLKVLELAFSHVSFLKFFGCYLCDAQDNYEICFEPSREAGAINKIRLKRLVLAMPTPADLIDIPWTNGCQKTMVDWILESAWPFVKGQPVTVTGFVKMPQKLEFETMARKEFERRRPWEGLRDSLGLGPGDGEDGTDNEEGGVRLDGDVAGSEEVIERVIEVETDEKDVGEDVKGYGIVTLPPICFCKVSCQQPENWKPVD